MKALENRYKKRGWNRELSRGKKRGPVKVFISCWPLKAELKANRKRIEGPAKHPTSAPKGVD